MNKNNNGNNLQGFNDEDKNYKLNLDILSSLKNIPGKIINLQEGYSSLKKEDLYQSNALLDEKFSTSFSFPKITFSDKYKEENINNEKSILKPIPFYRNTIGYHNNKYFDLNPIKSFPNFYINNQNSNQNLITQIIVPNNAYLTYPFYPLINIENPFKSISFPMLSKSQNLIFNNINNNAKKTFIMNKDNNNFLLHKKRKQNFENNSANIKENINTNNPKNSKLEIFKIPKIKKNMFNVYHKSQYVYKTRKRRINKSLIETTKLSCGHKGCELGFSTKNQLNFHHFKMSIECHKDTIYLLKMISLVKKILLKQKKDQSKAKNQILEELSLLYKETMKNITQQEYIDNIIGFNLEN